MKKLVVLSGAGISAESGISTFCDANGLWRNHRKERTLNFDDILHYQKIIVALFETDRLMKEIDTISIEN